MKLEISVQIFEKCSNIKFHENLSCGSRVVSLRMCGRTDRHGEAFRAVANAVKNRS